MGNLQFIERNSYSCPVHDMTWYCTCDKKKPEPHKCPVCDSIGKIYGVAETGTVPTKQCHGCDGKGWVVA